MPATPLLVVQHRGRVIRMQLLQLRHIGRACKFLRFLLCGISLVMHRPSATSKMVRFVWMCASIVWPFCVGCVWAQQLDSVLSLQAVGDHSGVQMPSKRAHSPALFLFALSETPQATVETLKHYIYIYIYIYICMYTYMFTVTAIPGLDTHNSAMVVQTVALPNVLLDQMPPKLSLQQPLSVL